MRGAGSVIFAGILLFVAGTLNILYGIAGIGTDDFFVNTDYVFSTIETWGWITLLLGIIQLIASFSLFAGGAFGRVIGISPPRSERSGRCCRSAVPTRSGRPACSRFA
ncbi:MAG: hypothetical protein WDZ37_02930 [Solirubrobacterales bacterium]